MSEHDNGEEIIKDVVTYKSIHEYKLRQENKLKKMEECLKSDKCDIAKEDIEHTRNILDFINKTWIDFQDKNIK